MSCAALSVVLACIVAALTIAAVEWGRLVGRVGARTLKRAAQLRNQHCLPRPPFQGGRSLFAGKRSRRASGPGPLHYRSSQGRLLSSSPPARCTADLESAGEGSR